jgi:Fe-S cluster assembly ATP-binding protein
MEIAPIFHQVRMLTKPPAKRMGAGVLIITHYRNILKYLEPDKVHIMIDGKIVRSGGLELVELVEEKGFKEVIAT